MQFITGEVAFAAITDPVRLTLTDPPYYLVAFVSEDCFISATQPRLYDRLRKLIPAQAIAPGSVVSLGLDVRRRIEAIQIVCLADDCPFELAA
jgi:hypothetical protein